MKIDSKWTVGIISTGFDLKNERTILIDDLKEKGFSVVAFEEEQFPFNVEKNKNEACLDAFNNIDVAIIVIGNELGHSDETGVSTTWKEYEHVLNLKKYIYVFVESHTWYNYQQTSMEKTIKSAPFLDFINHNKEGFITPYNDVIHLTELVKGRLEGLSITLVKEIANNQFKKIMELKTIPIVGNSIGEQINHYFITPQIEPEDDSSGNSIRVLELYKKLTDTKTTEHILIHGDIGSGKSTLLYFNYIEHYKAFVTGNEVRIPLYVSLRGKNADYTLEQYFVECFENNIGRDIYPLFKLKRKSYVLYLDGLDEMSNIKAYGDVCAFFESDIFKDLVMITCRTNFYEAYIQGGKLSEKLDADIKVCKWEQVEIEGYIGKIFSGKEENILKYLTDWVKKSFGNWLQTPLMISIVCFLLREKLSHSGIKGILDRIINERTLMIEYTKVFIERELERVDNLRGRAAQISDHIYLVLKEMAWLLCQQKLSSNYKLLDSLDNRDTLEFKIAESYFDVECFAGYYVYNVHEYFVDFMVSLYILDKMKSREDNNFLNYMLSANINKLILQGINEYDIDGKKNISENLFNAYITALENEEKNIIKRTHIVYYLSRIDMEENKKKLKKILYQKEKEVEIRLSICFGMVKLGDLEEEEFLYKSVEENIEWDKTNRGYHLLYYKDVENKEVPFQDDGKESWKKTYKALNNHICNEEQYYYLGRIDLQIMRKFLITHNDNLFESDDIEKLEKSILNKWNQQDPFGLKVVKEWYLLKGLLHSFMCNDND